MTHAVQRGLDAARSDQDLAREADRRQRAKALGLPLDASERHIEAVERGIEDDVLDRMLHGTPDGIEPRGFFAGETHGTGRVSSRHPGNGRRLGRPPVALRESQVEKDGDNLMQSCGFTVIRLSQRRRSKVHIGLPDRLYTNPPRGLAVWWEAKKPGGKRSKAQVDFQALVEGCGYGYVVGTTEPLRRWLETALEK